MINDLKVKLQQFNQEHLLDFVNELDENQRRTLIKDIEEVGLEKVQQIFKEVTQHVDQCENSEANILEPLSEQVYESIRDVSAERRDHYKKIGLNAIRDGKVGVILLAGGQGTRLGVNYPKGMYDVGLPSKKTLFQLQAERLKRLQRLASDEEKKAKIHWFIMTSGPTNQTTIDYFEKNQYFDLDRDQFTFFEQGTLPCFTFDGKIILNSKHELSRSPDGNGGLYDAIKRNGIIDKLKELKIEYLHAYSVDNILVKLADPTFIGYCIDKQADTAVKSVEKESPHEAVGIFCKVNGKHKVVEYSEISKELAEKQKENGKLAFGCGNICNHFYTTEFLSRIVDEKLPHHVAKKKIPFIDNNGNLIKPKPTEPNGIKLEKFIFDVIPFSKRFVVLEVIREEEFSPVKNNDSASKDSPTTARLSVFNLHRRLLENAGATVIKSDEQEVAICEISPLVSYEGENLDHIVEKKKIEHPVLITAEEEKIKPILKFV